GFGNYEVCGNLTMKGITKPVKLALRLSPVMRTSFSGALHFTIHGKLRRSDWCLDWKSPHTPGESSSTGFIELNCNLEMEKVDVFERVSPSVSRNNQATAEPRRTA